MWAVALAVAAFFWFAARAEDESDNWWGWDAAEGLWVWRWQGTTWYNPEELPWIRFGADRGSWSEADRGGAAGLWWTFAAGLPRRHPLSDDPSSWAHWLGPNPQEELARYSAQDALRAARWSGAARAAAALLPGPAEHAVLDALGLMH